MMLHDTTTRHGCDAAIIPTVCFMHPEGSSSVTPPFAFHAHQVCSPPSPATSQVSPDLSSLFSCLPRTRESSSASVTPCERCGFQLFQWKQASMSCLILSYENKIFKALSAVPMPCSSLISCCSAESNHPLSLLSGIFSPLSQHKSHP